MDTADTAPPDTDALSFEEALGQLEEVVAALESGQSTLEESITHYEQGMRLHSHCEKKLAAAEERVRLLSLKDDRIVAEPFPGHGD